MSVWGEGEVADVHALAGAYALDAVDPEERQLCARHRGAWETSPDEIRSFHATAAALAAAEPEEPPARLRGNVLEAAARTRQERPEPVRDLPRQGRLHRLLPIAAAVLLFATVALGGALAYNSRRLDEAH